MKRKSILDMTNIEAKDFLLKSDSYSNIEFPPYFKFDKILLKAKNKLLNKKLNDIMKPKSEKKNYNPKNYDQINYKLLTNKDGKYDWREFQLINPLLYITLVNELTEKKQWDVILNRFKKFRENTNIVCMSMPILNNDIKNKKLSILNWWEEIEQKSISLALKYSCLLQTDITNCYPSIYTHTISWAIHGKTFIKSKNNRHNQSLIGNIIDTYIQSMQYAQTNGIPQGSVLMDFISEMILGYVDLKLSESLKKLKIKSKDYYILRYRDDYKIFTNEHLTGEQILKELNAILVTLSLKLNSQKTICSNNVIEKSIKPDKMYWLGNNTNIQNIEKKLLYIYRFSLEFINAGQLSRALNDFFEYLEGRKIKKIYIEPLISIIVDIAYRNPRTQPVCCAIISKILNVSDNTKNKEILFKKIKDKLNKVSNNGYCELWLQRISLLINKNMEYEEKLCNLVSSNKVKKLWENRWLKKEFKNLLNPKQIIDRAELRKIKPVISSKEFNVFKIHSL